MNVNDNKENIIDVDYYTDEEYEKDNDPVANRTINGEPLFYSAGQVAQMIGEEISTVRYWGKRFQNLLDFEFSNKNRQYKKSDIEKLKFIKKLAREDGLTLKQIEEYCSSKGFDIDSIEKSVIDSTNPLAIQTFITAVTVEIDKKLNKFSEDLLNKISEQQKVNLSLQQEMNEKLQEIITTTVDEIVEEKLSEVIESQDQIKDLQQQHQETLKDYVAITIDEKLSEKISDQSEEIKSYMDTKEQESLKKDNEMIEMFKQHMEERKKESESKDQEKNKGFWGRLFNK